ncbi:MAG: hypothetical protein ACRD7E_09495 [Bryobacteraceae bacterium]
MSVEPETLSAATAGTSFGAATAPARNDRGIIAESYYDLQGLGVLAAARASYPLPKASGESTLRAIFQAVEVALLNLADVVGRAADDLESGARDAAAVKLLWARGFHRVLIRLSMMPEQLGLMADARGRHGILRLRDSQAFQDYLRTVARLDKNLFIRIRSGEFDVEATVGNESLDSADFTLLHALRISNHASTIWERNLAEVHIPASVPSYDEFVVAHGMKDAVYERVLTGDTYFTQFRGLHQVPEILGEEINDRIEQAIREIRYDRLQSALEHLACVDVLSEGVLASLPPMVDNLATSDYHQIRENLGLTSGSHSVCLRFHMFTHLYEELWEELGHQFTGAAVREMNDDQVEAMIRETDSRRFSDSRAWMLHVLSNHCLKLRTFIFQWRDEHLNLPRNNLGGGFTKSLTGSPDAVEAVKRMRDGARAKDPLLPLMRSRSLATSQSERRNGPLTQYLESESSLDMYLLAATGHVTQQRFQSVQERLGYFANKCPFTPPPRRKA